MAPTTKAGAATDAGRRYAKVAHRAADAAARITRQYFRRPQAELGVDTKIDESPVSIAEREAETAMRDVILASCPGHAVYGEEFGLTTTTGGGEEVAPPEYVWVLDPIDGTKSFITGKPLFGTLIALVKDGEPILGIIDQPILGERWVGVKGDETRLNDAPIAVRACGDLDAAYLYATSPHMFAGETEVAFNRLRDRVKVPLYGCDCYAYGLLAAGHCDVVCEADMRPYDFLALIPVVEGAGGALTDWTGAPFDRWDPRDVRPREVLATGDARLHEQALAALGRSPPS